MFLKYKIPKTIIWVINLFGIFLLIFTLFRLSTWFAFAPSGERFFNMLPSFFLGLRYDIRWISFILLPIVLTSLWPGFSPFYSAKNKKWWTWYLAIITFVIFFFFAADFGSFSYNYTRLDAGALNFVEDAGISLSMLWQTYPIFWMLMGLLVAVLFFRWMYKKSHWNVISKTDGLKIPYTRKWFVITALLLGILIFGNIGTSPLRWKDCFYLQNNFKSYLALNPLQNFFSTLRLRKPQFNESAARKAHPVVAEWMGLSKDDGFNYHRQVLSGSKSLESKPNIVLVLCESFSMYKSSMSGNPLNTTPYFNQLCNEGIFFERCFSPHFSTARGLFATVTGIPDVQLFKFSSRNPEAVQQHTIINSFTDYKKLYFLGGSPEFNNFEGILDNIDDLDMYTEGKLKSQKMNVWGVSDKNLFLEANKAFKAQSNPFFAIVQTADNHRPFMIPAEDSDFVKENIEKDTLIKYGFESEREFNSFRYMDYCVKKFIEAAKKEDYFHNTIFVFIGDHGVAGNAKAVYPDSWTSQRLTDEHIPLLFYSPYLFDHQKRDETVSQIDVLPTVAGMLYQPYINTTLGRDILHENKTNNYAFITNGQGKVGMVTDDYYFTMNLNFSDKKDYFPDYELFSVKSDSLFYTRQQKDSIINKLSEITLGYYETARWMLMNNRP